MYSMYGGFCVRGWTDRSAEPVFGLWRALHQGDERAANGYLIAMGRSPHFVRPLDRAMSHG